MTTYYADYTNGSDSNNGLGPDASDATNKPWKTIAKVLGASGIASGDTCYLAPGAFRERVTVAMTSATAETSIIGDPMNHKGFKTSGGVLVSPGPVIHTAFETNDTTAPSANADLLTMASRDYLTFQYINFVGGKNTGNKTISAESMTTATHITFRDCAIFGGPAGGALLSIWHGTDSGLNWLFDRCILMGSPGQPVLATFFNGSASAGIDIGFEFRNCLVLANGNGAGLVFTGSGTGSFDPGGMIVDSCTIIAYTCVQAGNASNASTTVPCVVKNSILIGQSGLSAAASGQITEDYNIIACGTARTNVTAGANSKSDGSRALAFHLGQDLMHGFRGRPAFTPFNLGAGIMGFGAGSSPPSVDALNRVRPSGGESTSIALGWMERHDTAQFESSVADAGSSAIKIVGPGDHDIHVPVNASSTTISIKGRYDTTHGTGSKPQASIIANPKIGVTAETVTMTAAVDTWETLTFAAQTPTAKGVVTIRLTSRSAGGGGIAYFDTVAVA